MKKYMLKGSAAVAAIAVGVSFTPVTAFAQDDEDSINPNADVIISVGTRRASRSAADSPAPVDVIGNEELVNQGDTDIQNILRTSVPSYNVNTQPISDAATLIRPANLRGLAPDSTLVLVNGKRRHRAAVISFLGGGISDGAQGPDISVIPTIALKQVEVLRDGAASQYGSDAIAGVINFALKDDDGGASFEAEWGQTYQGDGDQYSISANIGLPIPLAEGGFLNLSAEYGEVDATDRSVQRDDALGLIAAGNSAVGSIDVNTVTDEVVQIWGQPNINDDFTIFANSGLTITEGLELYAFGNYAERQAEGGFFFRNPTNRGGVFEGPQVNPATGFAVVVDDNGTPDDATDDFFLDSRTNAVVTDPSASVSVGDLSTDSFGDCVDGLPLTGTDGVIPDAAFLADVQADANCFSFVELFPGGFTPRFGGDLTDVSAVLGIRGEFDIGSGLQYDVSYTYGQNEAIFFINNTINASLGPDTPTSFVPGGYTQTDHNYNVDFAYGFENNVFASPIGLAFGFEHRREEFDIQAGDDASFVIGPLAAPSPAFPGGQGFASSSNGFGGFTGSNAGSNSQSNYALYFDTETDVTDQLIVQGAVRYEDFYDSFGDTLNYKVGALYKATDNISLRATYSTGFHAPTAGQANVTNVTTAFTGGVLQDQGTIPLSSAAGQFIADRLEASTGSRPTLGPEESRNFTAGVAFNVANVNVTLDYFRISVDNRISISDQQDFSGELIEFGAENGLTLDADLQTSQLLFALDGAGLLNADDFAGSEDLASFGFFSNSFDTRTQGIDVVANTSFDLVEGGRTTAALAFNWTDTTVTDRGLDGAAPLSQGRQAQLEDNLPAVRGNFTLNHYQGPFRGLARVNYFGEFFECHLDATTSPVADGGNGTPANNFCDLPIFAGAQVTVDLEAAVTVYDKVELVVGAQNVFDSTPDANPFAGVVGAAFPVTAPGGFNGGLYYGKIRVNF